jgi:hypothetical protein
MSDSTETKQAGQRKKKASRACIHCQKAHLTCDDCERLNFNKIETKTNSVFQLVHVNAALNVILLIRVLMEQGRRLSTFKTAMVVFF